MLRELITKRRNKSSRRQGGNWLLHVGSEYPKSIDQKRFSTLPVEAFLFYVLSDRQQAIHQNSNKMVATSPERSKRVPKADFDRIGGLRATSWLLLPFATPNGKRHRTFTKYYYPKFENFRKKKVR
jgi:hypothetical protein